MTSKKLQAVAGVTAVLILSKILGLVREVVIAGQYGTSVEYDLFLIGVIVPALVSGVLSFASYYWLVPHFSRLGNDKDVSSNSVWQSMWSMLSLTSVVCIALGATVAFLAPWLMRLWTMGLDEAQFELVVFFSRLTSALVVLATVEALLRAVLNARGKFVSPAFGLVLYNLVSIAIMLLLTNQYGAAAVGIGMLGGLVAQIALLLMRLTTLGAGKDFSLGFPEAWPAGVAKATGLLVLIELVNRSYFMIDRYFAPSFGEGVVSALNYAQVLALLPDAVVGASISSVIFPAFSRSTQQDSRASFAESYGRSIVGGLILSVPLALIAAFAAPEIVHLAFQRGAFDQESLRLTSMLFVPLTPIIASMIIATLSLRACYAFGWYTPVLLITIGLFVVKAFLTLLLANELGAPGIAMATTVAQISFALLLAAIVFGKVKELRSTRIMIQIIRVVSAGMITVAVMAASDRSIENVCAGDLCFSHAVIRLTMTAFVVGGVFLGGLYLFGLGPMLKSFVRPATVKESPA